MLQNPTTAQLLELAKKHAKPRAPSQPKVVQRPSCTKMSSRMDKMRQHHVLMHGAPLPTLSETKRAETRKVENVYSLDKVDGDISLRAIIAISRKSGHVDDNIVDALHKRNDDIYGLVQDEIHSKLHVQQRDPTQCEQQCPAEKFSVVLNGISSNEDMSSNKHSQLRNFMNLLSALNTEDTASSNLAVIAFCNFDGFPTNFDDLERLFKQLSRFQLVLVVIKGRQHYTIHFMADIFKAASELKVGIAQTLYQHHELVRGWVTVSLTKENLGHNSRDIRQIMPERRNSFHREHEERPGR